MDVAQLSTTLAKIIARFQEQEMARPSPQVTAIVERDLVIVHMQEVLSPSERDLAQTDEGQVLLQRFNNLLFYEGSSPSVKEQVSRTMQREILDMQTSMSPLTGSLVVVFTLVGAGQVAAT